MGSPESRNDWVHHWTALTAARDGEDPRDPIAQSARLAGCLTAAASALTEAGAAEADGQPESATALGLARALAADAPAAVEPADGPCSAPSAGGHLGRFLAALEEAAHAVYHCRRVLHPRGRCWFSAAGPDSGLCGEVLSAAHTMRASRTSLSG